MGLSDIKAKLDSVSEAAKAPRQRQLDAKAEKRRLKNIARDVRKGRAPKA